MSLDATRWAWQQDLRPSHKLLLLSLADRAGENHECYPSISRIEGDTGLHRVTIMEAIEHLEQLGLLAVSRMNGRGNRYDLIGICDRRAPLDQCGKPVRKTAPVQKSIPVQKTALDQCGKPHSDQCGKPHTESTNESTKNQTTARLPLEDQKTEHVNGLDATAWVRWETYRREIKKPIRPTSVHAAQRMLAKYGIAQADVVEQSIAQGWQGLFALKPDAQPQANSKQSAWAGAS